LSDAGSFDDELFKLPEVVGFSLIGVLGLFVLAAAGNDESLFLGVFGVIFLLGVGGADESLFLGKRTFLGV